MNERESNDQSGASLRELLDDQRAGIVGMTASFPPEVAAPYFKRINTAIAEYEALRHALTRAAYVVENLVQQVPEFTGVIGPGGEREDDYIALRLHEEVEAWRALTK